MGKTAAYGFCKIARSWNKIKSAAVIDQNWKAGDKCNCWWLTLLYPLRKNLPLTKKKIHPACSWLMSGTQHTQQQGLYVSEQGRMGSVRRCFGQGALQHLGSLQWGWAMIIWLLLLCRPLPWTQAASGRVDLSLWWEHPAALLKWDTLIHMCCPGFKAWMFILKSEHRYLVNPDSNRYLISPSVCSPLHLFVQETYDTDCVCVREGSYKHAQCFRVDIYKSSYLKH